MSGQKKGIIVFLIILFVGITGFIFRKKVLGIGSWLSVERTKVTTNLLRRPLAILQGGRLGETKVALVRRETTTVEKPVRFAVLSDIHSDTENLQKALDKINTDNIDFTIVTGDLTTLGKLSELQEIKDVLDSKTRSYYVIPGNHDVYTGNKIGQNLFEQVFGKSYQSFIRRPPADQPVDTGLQGRRLGENGDVKFILIDNAGDYSLIRRPPADQPVDTGLQGRRLGENGDALEGTTKGQWEWVERETEECQRIMCLVFMHMPVNHPNSLHIMGEGNAIVASQASELVKLLVKNKVRQVFAGHLHYSSSYTIDGLKTQIAGAVAEERNWQEPRFMEVEILGERITANEVIIDSE